MEEYTRKHTRECRSAVSQAASAVQLRSSETPLGYSRISELDG